MKFYDTSSLLLKAGNLFDEKAPFAISSITLKELEEIKVSFNKDADIKYAARCLLRELDEHRGEYEIKIFKESMLAPIIENDLPISNDMKILASAIGYDTFITNDLALKSIAEIFFKPEQIESAEEVYADDYSGYFEIIMDDAQMEEFYSNLNTNLLDAKINQYIIIKNPEGKIVDRRIWTGEIYRTIGFENFRSMELGDIRPMPGDFLQQFAADSFCHNKITMIKGPAGTGKSQLSLGFLFWALEKHKIDKIIIFCNTVAVKGAAKLGYLPGSREEKLLDSQIGNFLISKLGDRLEVERLVDEGKLLLLPMADIRGYDTSNMRAGIYITEAQNLDISLMKLALQRIGEDSICIIDGDEKTQVDDVAFSGANNGMRRLSQVFRGQDLYGEIELQKIYRSRIAELAQQM